MPAKELTPEQTRDADRLKAAYRLWQSSRREQGLPWTQEETEDITGYKQSALSQYLNGKIPLNAQALMRICSGINADPMTISPHIVAEQAALSSSLQAAADKPSRQGLILAASAHAAEDTPPITAKNNAEVQASRSKGKVNVHRAHKRAPKS